MKRITMIRKRINGKEECRIDVPAMISRESKMPEGRDGLLSIRQISRIHAITGASREAVMREVNRLGRVQEIRRERNE